MFRLASIRMRAYGIKPDLDRLNALRIVGNSIPAVATSTAIAAGLVCIELYKVALKLDSCTGRAGASLDPQQRAALCLHFSQHHGNTGYNTYNREDAPALQSLEKSYKRLGTVRWTAWDVWTIDGYPTVADVFNFLEAKGVDVTQIQGVSICPALL